MSSYDEYDAERFQNSLAAYRPHPSKQDEAVNMTIYSKPEPTSKTKIPKMPTTTIVAKNVPNFFSKKLSMAASQSHF